MALVDIHDVAFVYFCVFERTHAFSSRLYEYSVPFALLIDCVNPPRSANNHCTMECKVAGYSSLI